MQRRALPLLLVLAFVGCAKSSANGASRLADFSTRQRALVYRDQNNCPGCSESVGAVLEGQPFGFDVAYVGPGEEVQVSKVALDGIALYAQPGADGSLVAMADALESYGPILRTYVNGGGRFIGFCMGAYLAGSSPGFGLLPGDVQRYVESSGADVTSTEDTTVTVDWGGKRRKVYFQDGPYFTLAESGAGGETVLAHYAANDTVAALVVPVGSGKVGVVGPHPEADAGWFSQAGLSAPTPLALDLAIDLVTKVMQ